MDPVIANSPGATSDAASRPARRWLRRDEGWAPSEDLARLAAAIGIALGAVALKVVIVGVLGGELGYLSYLGAVALGAWIAGARGGAIATIICAIAQTVLFSRAATPDEAPYVVFSLGLFLVDGAIVTILSSNLRRAYVREHAARTTGEADLELQSSLHQAAERDRATLATLQTVTASLSGAQTPTEVGDAILDRGLVALGATAGGVSRVLDGEAEVEVLAVRGYPDTEPATRVPIQRPSHLAEAIDTGRPVFLSDIASWSARYPDSPPRSLAVPGEDGAIAVLPMVAGTRTLGAIVFRFSSHRDFADGTGDLALRLAEQGAQALDRALAWDRDRRSREALERGQGRLAVLVRASDILGLELNVTAAVGGLPALIVPALADWCAIELLEQDALGLSVAAAPGCEDAVRRLAGRAPRSLGSWLAPESAVHGPTVMSRVDAEPEFVADPEGAAALRELDTRAILGATIAGPEGKPLGSIVLGANDAERFGPEDQALVGDLASRIAAAIERAGLFAAMTRFRATVDAAGDAVYMFDPGSLRLTYVNRGGADLLGSEPGALVGTPVLDLQPAVSERVFRARLADLREARGGSMSYAEVLARADGRVLPAEVFLQEVTLGDGTRTVILTARDISERIDVQARLARIAGDERRQAAELRAVIASMGDGVLVVDADGAVTMANDAANGVLGPDLADGLAGSARGCRRPTTGPPADGPLDDGRWIEIATYPADLGGGIAIGPALADRHPPGRHP